MGGDSQQAIVAQINNFGQTPKKLFDKAHPVRHVQPKQPPLVSYLKCSTSPCSCVAPPSLLFCSTSSCTICFPPAQNIYSWPEVISSAPVRLSSSLAPEAIYYCAFHGSSEKIACQPGNRILIPVSHWHSWSVCIVSGVFRCVDACLCTWLSVCVCSPSPATILADFLF